MPATAIFFPLLFKLFLSLMIYLAVQEYLQVLFQLRYRLTPEQKADKKEDDTDITTPKKGRRRLSSASKKEEPVMGGESGEMTKFLNFARKIQVAGLLVSMSAYPGNLQRSSDISPLADDFLFQATTACSLSSSTLPSSCSSVSSCGTSSARIIC